MKQYKGIDLGERSETKVNFYFKLQTGQEFVRHSESSIKQLVKDLSLKYAFIYRDKGSWTINQKITKEWVYTPRY